MCGICGKISFRLMGARLPSALQPRSNNINTLRADIWGNTREPSREASIGLEQSVEGFLFYNLLYVKHNLHM